MDSVLDCRNDHLKNEETFFSSLFVYIIVLYLDE